MKFSALVAALLALTLVACGEKAAAPAETTPAVEAASAAVAVEAAPAAATTAAPVAPAAK